MELNRLIERAVEIRAQYSILEEKKYGKAWDNIQIALGLVGDIGDLAKAVMAKEGLRELEDADSKLRHELSDCLWCIMVLADKYGVNLEKDFLETMDILEKKNF